MSKVQKSYAFWFGVNLCLASFIGYLGDGLAGLAYAFFGNLFWGWVGVGLGYLTVYAFKRGR